MKRKRAETLGVAGATAWMADRVEGDPEYGEVLFPELYADACRWHEVRGLPHPSRQALGVALGREYVKRHATRKVTLWTLKLKDGPTDRHRIDHPNVPLDARAPAATGVPDA